jgi:hypothetical protein
MSVIIHKYASHKTWYPPGSVLGPLLFLHYVNNLPQITNNKFKIVLYAGDTSVIITNHNPLAFISGINEVFENINDWLNANLLSLNTDKTYFMQFSTNIRSLTELNSIYDHKISNI